MGKLVCMGAQLQCSCGSAPSGLMTNSVYTVLSGGMPVANNLDHQPLVNIPLFGVCNSQLNAHVAAATAAYGQLTAMPCIPDTPSAWVTEPASVYVSGHTALNESSKLMCKHGGEISILFAKQG